MLSKKMQDALNGQINKEMYSAYLYMAMSAQATDMGLDGFARWFMVQYHEEMFHAMKIYNYVFDRDGRVELEQIEKPPVKFDSIQDMFEKTLEHEEFVTKSINELVDLAISEKDHATNHFLQWYVEEQVEEEKNDHEILAKIDLLSDSKKGPGLYMLDKELGARTLTAPADFSVSGFAEAEG
ncbi:MAG: ferritin [Spirochaetaceae bacterium]